MSNIKRLLVTLILILSFQSLTKADDIRDFQIEGMSLGDSLLDFYTKNEIKRNIKFSNYKSDKYQLFEIYKSDYPLKQYDALMIHFKKSDKNYKIFSVAGVLEFSDNIKGCLSKQKEIDLELFKVFDNLEKNEYGFNKSQGDPTGKSKFNEIEYLFSSNDQINIQCYDWSKKSGYMDHLRIGLHHGVFLDWINNEAYK